MREQLIKYVDLLFAGTSNTHDIKEEILQNTLDRYDDLIAQGKAPAAAYSLAISGIGDISELLDQNSRTAEPLTPQVEINASETEKPFWKKILFAIGIFLYIICPIPLFVLNAVGMDTLGLCGTLGIVAIATVLMILSGNNKKSLQQKEQEAPENDLEKAIGSIIFTVGLCGYLALSFATNAWHITWLIFPIIAAVKGLIKAIMDLIGGNEK